MKTPEDQPLFKFGCSVELHFPFVKLITLDRAQLERTRSAVAAFILAYLDTMATRRDPYEQMARRIAHYRRVLAAGFAPELFGAWYVSLTG